MPLSVSRTAEECGNVPGRRFRRMNNFVGVCLCVEAFLCFPANWYPGTQFRERWRDVQKRATLNNNSIRKEGQKCHSTNEQFGFSKYDLLFFQQLDSSRYS